MENTVTIPKTMKALVVQEGRRVAVQDYPVPEIGDDDILVKTVAVAQNPTDYKFIDSGRGKPGTVLGCDWSGVVVRVGPNVTTPKVGDHAGGFVMGGTFPDSGAFAEYVKTPAELAWVVPEGTLTHEEAVTMQCGLWTAAQALYHPARLGLVEPPGSTVNEEWVYIHGGSSSVGQFAIQLATLSGYKVATTASPRNFPLVRSLGASAVFDYADPEVVKEVKAATDDSIRFALDTIGLREAQAISTAVIAPGGGKVVHILRVIPDATERTDVERVYTAIYWALGRAYSFGPDAHFPARPEDRTHMAQFLKKIPALVKDGLIKPMPIKRWEGGLEAIPEGLQYMRQGKVHAEKVVYRL
ncbi:GroES-like protein [Trametes punicea]|nr:GroES-like protein [Trametes punicea]